MWNRIKSVWAAGWVVAVSCAWLVPLAMAGDRLLAYLNDDLARLQFKAATTAVPSLLDINESPNITAARVLLVACLLLLAVAIVFWSIRAHRSFRAEGDRLDGLRTRLKERERALEQQFQYLEATPLCCSMLAQTCPPRTTMAPRHCITPASWAGMTSCPS